MKRTGRLKRRGKQAAYYARENPARRAWRESQPERCMVCGGKGDWRGLAAHEIERRSHSNRSFNEANYLKVCQTCHEGPLATMGHARQLAYKLMHDAEHFDLRLWLRIRDPELRAPRRVTLQEVVNALVELVKGER